MDGEHIPFFAPKKGKAVIGERSFYELYTEI